MRNGIACTDIDHSFEWKLNRNVVTLTKKSEKKMFGIDPLSNTEKEYVKGRVESNSSSGR